jgi:hypothetical protein
MMVKDFSFQNGGEGFKSSHLQHGCEPTYVT